MKVLTTLAERTYFLGFAALINSVVQRGIYIDKIVVGYRGALPNWLPKLSENSKGKTFKLKCGVEVSLILLDGNLHMVHEKPKWFQHLTHVLEPDADEYFFFDSDIVITTRMSFFGEWVKQGVALCEDVNYEMSSNHPIRRQWALMAQEDQIPIRNEINRYYNSGFLGWTRANAGFVDDWERCFQVLAKRSGDMTQFRVHDRTQPVLSANQDSFNLAAMATAHPISTIGPEAMGFSHGLNIMSHPIGRKPWSRSLIADFFKGNPPRASDLHFWQTVNGDEFAPCSPFLVARKVFLCKALRGLGRIYQKI